MGLGSLKTLSLKEAREEAAERKRQIAAGDNPIAVRAQERRAQDPTPSFGAIARELIAAKSPAWRNAKHAAQWATTVETHAKALTDQPVAELDTAAILSVLTPIWGRAPETASRLRGRIEAIIDAARAHGHIPPERANPARWRGHLDKLLPKRPKLSRGHHAALDYADMPGFMARLRQIDSVPAVALEFTILTAGRAGEVLGARWSELDEAATVWTIPGGRMKSAALYRVPLSARAQEIVRQAATFRSSDFVFPGLRAKQPLGESALMTVLRDLESEATVHGFRSTFRDWCGNETNTPREIAEAALAHAIGGSVEQAYRRSDALEKRRTLMELWASYCAKEPDSNVVQIGRRS
jgi:integrase